MMTGGISLGDDEDEYAASKSRKKKTRQQKQDKAGKVVATRPIRIVVIALLLLIAFSYLLDGGATAINGICLEEGHVSDAEIWPTVFSIVAYWIPAFILLLSSKDGDATKAPHLKAITLTCQLSSVLNRSQS